MSSNIQKSFTKPKLPTPIIPNSFQKLRAPHFSTPSGMLLPQGQQPPPMFGLRGSTIPAKYLNLLPNYRDLEHLQQEHPYKNPLPNQRNCQRNKNYIQQKKVQNSIFCDFCDQGFKNNDILERHKMQNHREILGIKKIVYTEQEICEWKEARKKRYPTTQNVVARQQAQEERNKRGERIEENKMRFGRKHDRRPIQQFEGGNQNRNYGQKSQNSSNRGRNRRKRGSGMTQQSINSTSNNVGQQNTCQADGDENETRMLDGLPMFQGTAKLEGYQLKQTNALSCLGNYGSDEDSVSSNASDHNRSQSFSQNSSQNLCFVDKIDEKQILEDEIPPDEQPIIKIDPFTDQEIASTPIHEPPPSSTLKGTVDVKCHGRKRSRKQRNSNPIAECSTSVVGNELPTSIPEKHDETINQPPLKKSVQIPWHQRYKRYQNTMLEKLLEPDIRHERNVLLQCVRFVVQNEFFGIGTENQESQEVKNNPSSNESQMEEHKRPQHECETIENVVVESKQIL